MHDTYSIHLFNLFNWNDANMPLWFMPVVGVNVSENKSHPAIHSPWSSFRLIINWSKTPEQSHIHQRFFFLFLLFRTAGWQQRLMTDHQLIGNLWPDLNIKALWLDSLRAGCGQHKSPLKLPINHRSEKCSRQAAIITACWGTSAWGHLNRDKPIRSYKWNGPCFTCITWSKTQVNSCTALLYI